MCRQMRDGFIKEEEIVALVILWANLCRCKMHAQEGGVQSVRLKEVRVIKNEINRNKFCKT